MRPEDETTQRPATDDDYLFDGELMQHIVVFDDAVVAVGVAQDGGVAVGVELLAEDVDAAVGVAGVAYGEGAFG